MKHESNEKNKLEVEDLDFNIDLYLEKYIKNEDLKNTLKVADIVLLPYDSFGDKQGPIFPEQNSEFYNFLSENFENEKIEICVETDDYVELTLHGELINIGTILLKDIAIPVICTLIVNYIESKIGNKKSKVKVVFIEKQGNSYKEFKYEGNLEYLSETVDNYLNKGNENGN